jgi:hypothetical protein
VERGGGGGRGFNVGDILYKEGRSGGWDGIFTMEIKTIPARNFSGNVQVLARRFSHKIKKHW